MVKSALVVTNPESRFAGKHLLINPQKLAEKLAIKTEKRVTDFIKQGGSLQDYFHTTPTLDEFFSYLVLEKKLPVSKALYHTVIKQNSSKHYKQDPKATGMFVLKNWVEWRARDIVDVLYRGDFNRERANLAKKNAFVKDVAHAITDAVEQERPPVINIKVFWGGHKESKAGVADEYDEIVLDRLKKIAGSLEKKGVKAGVTLLFSDAHSAWINGVEREQIEKYFNSISNLAGQRGFAVEKLSQIWDFHNPFAKTAGGEPESDRIQILKAKARELLQELGAAEKEKLTIAAKRHSRMVKIGKETPEESIRKYYELRHLERELIFDRTHGPERSTFLSLTLKQLGPSARFKPFTLGLTKKATLDSLGSWKKKNKLERCCKNMQERKMPEAKKSGFFKKLWTRFAPYRPTEADKLKARVSGAQLITKPDIRLRGAKLAAALVAASLAIATPYYGAREYDRYQTVKYERVMKSQRDAFLLKVSSTAEQLKKAGVRNSTMWAIFANRIAEIREKEPVVETFTPQEIRELEKFLEAGKTSPHEKISIMDLNLILPLLSHIDIFSNYPNYELERESLKTAAELDKLEALKFREGWGYPSPKYDALKKYIIEHNADKKFRPALKRLATYWVYYNRSIDIEREELFGGTLWPLSDLIYKAEAHAED